MKNVKHTDAIEDDVPVEDALADKISEAVIAKLASSIPGDGELARRTEGFGPRTRFSETRDAMLRQTRESEDYFRRLFNRETIGKLYISPEDIPEGVQTLWARQYFKGSQDSSNMRELERKGWRYATPEDFPNLAYTDDNGGIRDDMGRIANNEYYLMYRPNWVGKLEEEKNNREIQRKSSLTDFVSKDANFQGSQPFARVEGHETKYSSNYASTQKSNEFLREFSNI